LVNLYNAIAAIEGKSVQHPEDTALWATALEGSDLLATAALDRFFLSLGGIAGDVALAHGSNAVVIAGGLGYRLKDRFATSGFADPVYRQGPV
jgi:glucokinase